MRLAIRLNFEIFEDDDGWTARCDELGISTCTEKPSELETMIEAMVRDYLEACLALGTLGDVMSKISEGGASILPESMTTVPPIDMVAKYVREKRQSL